MKQTLLFLSLISCFLAYPQKANKTFYNFQTDYYWDSTLYRSEMTLYFELKGKQIIECNYPVKQYQYSTIIKDSPFIQKDFYLSDNFKYEPYSYQKNKQSISIVFFDHQKKQRSSHINYLLNPHDSVDGMLDKSMLIEQQSNNGLSFSGTSKYIGKKIILVNNHPRVCYSFIENHKRDAADLQYYIIREMYLDSANLVPVQYIDRTYTYNDQYTHYYNITKVKSITTTLPNFKTPKDLLLYELKTLQWTAKQRAVFLSKSVNDPKGTKYLNCILNQIDGVVSFYNYEINPLFKSIVRESKCEE